MVDISGADHQRQFTVRCDVPTMQLQATSQASSRRAAEKAAASEVLAAIAENIQSVESGAVQVNDTNQSSN